MSSQSNSVEDTVSAKYQEVRGLVEERVQDGIEYVRNEPGKAIAYALATGYVLRILPVGAMIRGVVRLGVSALKPVVLLYAAAKTYEMLQDSEKETSDNSPKKVSGNSKKAS